MDSGNPEKWFGDIGGCTGGNDKGGSMPQPCAIRPQLIATISGKGNARME